MREASWFLPRGESLEFSPSPGIYSRHCIGFEAALPGRPVEASESEYSGGSIGFLAPVVFSRRSS